MQITAVAGFAAVAFTLIAVPGPDWAYVLAAGAHDRVVLPAVTGLMIGYTLITLVVVAGAGPLLTRRPFALTVLTVAGAGYLTYLGVRTIRASGRVPGAPQAPLASSPGRYLVRGIGVSALNPKGLLVFLSILPQFTRESGAWPLSAQIAVLGSVFVLITALFYVPLGYAADRVLGARPGLTRITTRIAGAAMIVLGLALLAEHVLHDIG
ncbi:LysE family translocator [Kineosporia sp. J2-2]|uniref:LysE family translocator n=1 Tax=Kineosporia corallincola TaxID=2835133 RepID=A0ABS5TS73_9ACTN|nr:LysE family translocator [Kineosporia corallincola]MBT0773658.1 LysE family translocator [Kineosporia corallincola]